jgi:hypothetical protein
MINPHTCQNPGYGKLHIGFYIAALNDAIDRALQLSSEDEEDNDHPGKGPDPGHGGDGMGGTDPNGGPHRGKGSGNTPPDRGSKRGRGDARKNRTGRSSTVKTRAGDSECAVRDSFSHPHFMLIQPMKQMLFQTKHHNIALVYLQYGIYDSPVPAAFRRNITSILPGAGLPSPPSPSPGDGDHRCTEEHMVLILTSETAEGATGIVHGATLRVETSDRTHLTGDVVVKLSLLDEQKVRLRNEYAIYQTLEANGVKGLSGVLGIFDDMEKGPTILVLTQAGTPLHPDRALSSSHRYMVPACSLINVPWAADCFTIEVPFWPS